jgi:hypothetical protein
VSGKLDFSFSNYWFLPGTLLSSSLNTKLHKTQPAERALSASDDLRGQQKSFYPLNLDLLPTTHETLNQAPQDNSEFILDVVFATMKLTLLLI